MTKTQQDIFKMYQVIYDVLQSNNAIWSSNIPFSASVAALGNNIDAIAGLLGRQLVNSTGITQDKNNFRKNLEELSNELSSIIIFFATRTGNSELLVEVPFNASDYTLARDMELPGMSMRVHKAAVDNAAALLPFGVTGAMITALQTAIDKFIEYLGKPREAIDAAAEATAKIPSMLTETTKLLNEQLDKIMELFRVSNADFYAEYFIARIIVNTPHQKRALKASFIDGETNAPVAKAKIKVDGKLMRPSSAKGVIYVQHLSEVAHKLEVSAENFEAQKISFSVIKGETTKLVVKLKRIA